MRRLVVPALMLTAALGLCSCGGTDDGAPAGPEPITVKVSYAPFMTYAPILIAHEEGYFEEQGLNVEFVSLKRSSHGLPALSQGDLDVLSGAINAGLINTIARGADIRIVADKGYVSETPKPNAVIVARRDLADEGVLTDPARIKGKSLISNRDNVITYFVDKALARVGLTIDDMDVRYVPSPARIDALEKGAIDFAQLSEPWATRALDTGKVVTWVADHEVVPELQFTYVAFGPSLRTKHPEAGKKFMVAYLKGVRQYSEGKTDRNVQIIAKHTKLEPDLLKRLGWLVFRQNGRINVPSVMAFQTWAAERKLIDRVLKPEEFWDPTFVDHADAALKDDAERSNE